MAFSLTAATKNSAAFTTATAPTCAYAGSGPSASSMLVATIATDHGTTTPARTVTSITDTLGNAWALAAIGTLSATQFLDGEIWYCKQNKASGANTLTVNLSGAATAGRIHVMEFPTSEGAGGYFQQGGGGTNSTASATSLAINPVGSGWYTLGIGVAVADNSSALAISATGWTNDDQYTSTNVQADSAYIFTGSGAVGITFTFASHRYEAGAVAGFYENMGPRNVPPNRAAMQRAMYR